MRSNISVAISVIIYVSVLCAGLHQQVGSRSCVMSRLHDATLSDIPFRGTTVPTTTGSNDVSCRTESSLSRRTTLVPTEIDPTEPSSFGYVKVGKVLAAHGVKGDVKVLMDTDFAPQHVKLGSVVFIRKPGRRSPRPVLITSSRRQGVAADNTYLLQLNNIRSRTVAGALKQYDVYVRDSAAKPKLSKDEFLIRDIVGMDCYFHSDYDAVCVSPTADAVGTQSNNSDKPQPMGKVVGVVPPDELCVGAAAAQLMHAQLEIQLLAHEAAVKLSNKLTNIESNGGASKRKLFGKSERAAKKDTSTTQAAAQPGKRTGKVVPQYCLIPLVRSIVPVVDSVRRCVFLDPPAGLLELTYELHDKPGPVRGFLPAHIPSLSQDERRYLRDRTTLS